MRSEGILSKEVVDTFRLDDKELSAIVSDSVAVGARVKVTEKVGEDGRHLLTVELEEATS